MGDLARVIVVDVGRKRITINNAHERIYEVMMKHNLREKKMIPGLNKYSLENAPPQTTGITAERQLVIGRYVQQFQGFCWMPRECTCENVTESEIEEARSLPQRAAKKLTAGIEGLDEADKYLANHLCSYGHYYCLTALDDAVENFGSPTAGGLSDQKLRKNPLFQRPN